MRIMNRLDCCGKIKNKGGTKMRKQKMDLSEVDDEDLTIMYQWAQNAILCHTAQQTERIIAIITEYQRRGL